MTVWAAGASTGYCVHGTSPCIGDPTRQLPACLPTEHHYCAHGIDARRSTSDGQHMCPYCRGVTRRTANPSTWRPRRRDIALATQETPA